jgi:hypothetical protein
MTGIHGQPDIGLVLGGCWINHVSLNEHAYVHWHWRR